MNSGVNAVKLYFTVPCFSRTRIERYRAGENLMGRQSSVEIYAVNSMKRKIQCLRATKRVIFERALFSLATV